MHAQHRYPEYMNEDLEFALRLADAADQLSLRRFHDTDLHVENKPDMTPVTDADRAVETKLRDLIAAERPGDEVYGEEGGGNAARMPASPNGRRWIIDPIDGTKNYLRGVPIWATLIALQVQANLIIGVVSAPALGRRWWGALPAAGAAVAYTDYCGIAAARAGNPRRLKVSGVSSLGDASASFASPGGWQELGRLDRLKELCMSIWRCRAYGDFYSYMLVAEGAVDFAAEPELNLYDMAALVPVVTAAGGTFTGLDGSPGPWSGNALASNGALHDAVLARIG